jgi:hypothetical protein
LVVRVSEIVVHEVVIMVVVEEVED